MRTGLPIYEGTVATELWKQQRHAIIQAILRRDPELARFEAQRRREYVLQRVANAESVI
jgi:DNA-binding FadR family transcriptional regulator